MNKLNMKSKDIVSDNITKIAKLFPNVVKETEEGHQIDLELLKQELSNDILDNSKERYQLTWPGKRKSIIESNASTTNTLRPIIEKSVDFENTENIYIEGDNLEVLKILQESYLNKIKCIYIDPPYNTGNDFIYNDNFKKNKVDEFEESGQINQEGKRLVSNTESNGKFHSDWLSMIYPRLKLSRNLLTNDGVIFISIDENEKDNLVKIANEIFGEYNYITTFVRKTVEHMRVNADYQLQKLYDYVLVYAKNKLNVKFKREIVGEQTFEFKDKMGYYTLKPFQNSGSAGTRAARPNLYYPIYYDEVNESLSLIESEKSKKILPQKIMNQDGRWLWSKEKFEKDNNLLEYKNQRLHRKIYYNDGEDTNKYRSYNNWLEDFPNRLGASSLHQLELNGLFDYSKPVQLMKFLSNLILDDDDIILDFFAGSSTTAHAVIEQNSEDNGNRKYIMVQLDEEIDEQSEAYKQGYEFITDIGQERIKRAAKKIKEETNADIDYGFRVYALISSNMKDVFYKPKEYNQEQMQFLESNIKEDRTSLDVLSQIILELGLPLDLKIKETEVLNNKVFFVEDNSLIACFDENIDSDLINEISKYKPLKIVLKESSFQTDKDKINLEEKLKLLSPETELRIL